MTQPLTTVIVGAGHRALTYAAYAQSHPEELRIVGVADLLPLCREKVAALYNLPPERCFATAAELAAQRYACLSALLPCAHPAAVQACREQVRVLAHVLLPQVRSRQEALERLGQLFSQHQDAFLFASLPGAGKLLAPALLAKFVDLRTRFTEASEAQALAGTCPLTQLSGQRQEVHFRHGCDREFRRIAQQFALASLGQSARATAYWQEIRPHCRSDSHATRVLANRWLAIIWKLWQTHQAYDEAYHLQQRAQRRVPKCVFHACLKVSEREDTGWPVGFHHNSRTCGT